MSGKSNKLSIMSYESLLLRANSKLLYQMMLLWSHKLTVHNTRCCYALMESQTDYTMLDAVMLPATTYELLESLMHTSKSSSTCTCTQLLF